MKLPVLEKLKTFPDRDIPELPGYPHPYFVGPVPPEVLLLNLTELPESILIVTGLMVTVGRAFTVMVLVMLAVPLAESLTVAVTE